MIINFIKKQVYNIQNHLKIPFYGNAYALIALQVSTSILGFVFWAVATRVMSADKIGIGTALYSAAMLLISLSILGFDDGLTYFLPRSKRPNLLINTSFSITGALSILLSVGFIAGIKIWSPNLRFLLQTPITLLTFVACVVVLQVSAMQDGLFVAERLSKYVLFKGIAMNLLRIPIFMILMMTAQWNFLLSAALAVFAAIVLSSAFYKRKERPDFQFSPMFFSLNLKPMFKFSFGNFVTNTVVSLPNTLLPLIILTKLGAEANAYFYLAWMLGSMINVIGRSFGTSLFVESGHDETSIKKNILRSLKTASIMVIPGVLGLSLFAHPILLLLGKDYGANSTMLVILIAISSIPLTVHGIAVGILKAKGKVKELILLGAVFTGLHLSLAIIFSTYWGLSGLGYSIITARFISALMAFLLAVNLKFETYKVAQIQLP